MIDDTLPEKVKSLLDKISNVYLLLERKENFLIDPLKGSILLLIGRKDEGRKLEESAEIQLRLVGNEGIGQECETELSEFGGKIEDLEFPEFGDE